MSIKHLLIWLFVRNLFNYDLFDWTVRLFPTTLLLQDKGTNTLVSGFWIQATLPLTLICFLMIWKGWWKRCTRDIGSSYAIINIITVTFVIQKVVLSKRWDFQMSLRILRLVYSLSSRCYAWLLRLTRWLQGEVLWIALSRLLQRSIFFNNRHGVVLTNRIYWVSASPIISNYFLFNNLPFIRSIWFFDDILYSSAHSSQELVFELMQVFCIVIFLALPW